MKFNRNYLFIALSSVALVIVLIIQVNWILQTARVKEQLFNEKANLVLSKTAEALAFDTVTCRNLEVCVGRNETHTIDSLFTYYMNFYNFHIRYSFEVKTNGVSANKEMDFVNGYPDKQGNYYKSIDKSGLTNKSHPEQAGCYKKSLEDAVHKKGLELKLLLPGKEQFIREEMGTMFITSVILILAVFILSWRTTLSLMREKKISEHTTDFLNNMTHEFKTPLTNIALAGKMIIKDSNHRQDDKIKHYSEIILEENEKLRLQVEQVLSMTALERGEIPLQKTELDLHELIRASLKCISIQIENKEGDVTLKLDADKHVVTGDKIHLTNALCNLVDNAIKYAKEKPEVSIQTVDHNEHIQVVISDKGIGIEKEYQKKVFDKFFRVPTGDVHDVKGFGLGLAYTKKIIELHGGSIELESEKGKGTIFTITLPHV
jgi:two-component system phosphate regulon sensor histidine kinase PhoR